MRIQDRVRPIDPLPHRFGTVAKVHQRHYSNSFRKIRDRGPTGDWDCENDENDESDGDGDRDRERLKAILTWFVVFGINRWPTASRSRIS